MSRALSHQLVRHRIGVAFDQQSQRYVKYKEPQYVTPPSIEANPDALQEFERFRDVSEEIYHRFLEQGIPAEDARFIFPNAVATNLIMTVNLRQLMHMAGLRLCTLAQWEIRQMFKLIRKEVMAADPYFGRLLVPKCVPLGYCDEKRNEDEHCRIRPHKNSVFRVWELYKRGALVERETPKGRRLSRRVRRRDSPPDERRSHAGLSTIVRTRCFGEGVDSARLILVVISSCERGTPLTSKAGSL